MKKFVASIILCILFLNAVAQNFQNGDLDGVINGNSCLPDYWQRVPYTDVNCIAAVVGNDTPDLTSLTEPNAVGGIIGNPFAGNTFVSGAFGSSPPNFAQEGIMQQVTGFAIGNEYIIRFRQAVTKQSNAIDESGSWAVFIDTLLAGLTLPTNSKESFNSTSFEWDLRTINFTATSTSHLIKFLPIDDDSNYVFSLIDTTGALRMGIDSIGLEAIIDGLDSPTNLPYGEAFKLMPNPNNGAFEITCSNNNLLSVSIQNLAGQLVYNKIIQPQNMQAKIDDAILAKGIYILKVADKNGVQCLKLVVE